MRDSSVVLCSSSPSLPHPRTKTCAAAGRGIGMCCLALQIAILRHGRNMIAEARRASSLRFTPSASNRCHERCSPRIRAVVNEQVTPVARWMRSTGVPVCSSMSAHLSSSSNCRSHLDIRVRDVHTVGVSPTRSYVCSRSRQTRRCQILFAMLPLITRAPSTLHGTGRRTSHNAE